MLNPKYCVEKIRGYTLLELIIASSLGLATIGLAGSAILTNRGLLLRDTARIEVNQNLRASVDIIGSDIRQAGENLIIRDFPIIQLNDNSLNSHDELIVRSSLLLNTFSVCQDADSENLLIGDTTAGGIADCPVAGRGLDPADELPDSLFLWEEYRQEQEDIGEPTTAFIYDFDSLDGELFEIESIFRTAGTSGDDPAEFFVQSTSSSWSGTYESAGRLPLIAIIDERRFFLDENGFLNTQVNGGVDRILANEVTDFQVIITTQDGVEHTDFNTADGDSWADIRSIQVTIGASSEFAANRNISNTISSQFLPRNILSFTTN
ncbi:MAG: hypothetical protein AAGC93_28225 [Cyanobacteria bacterium P01_F01_bin.53]